MWLLLVLVLVGLLATTASCFNATHDVVHCQSVCCCDAHLNCSASGTTTTTTTTAASTTKSGGGGGAGNTTDDGGVTDDGTGIGDTGGLDLRTLLLLLLAAMLGALLLAALIIGCLIWRRRRKQVCYEYAEPCKPKCGAAFYQVTGGVVPAYMPAQKQCVKPSCVLGAYRPGCTSYGAYQMYGQSPRFGQQGATRFI